MQVLKQKDTLSINVKGSKRVIRPTKNRVIRPKHEVSGNNKRNALNFSLALQKNLLRKVIKACYWKNLPTFCGVVKLIKGRFLKLFFCVVVFV